jgi:hypothetical protein
MLPEFEVWKLMPNHILPAAWMCSMPWSHQHVKDTIHKQAHLTKVSLSPPTLQMYLTWLLWGSWESLHKTQVHPPL